MCFLLLNPHRNPTRLVIQSYHYYIWLVMKLGLETLSNLLKIRQEPRGNSFHAISYSMPNAGQACSITDWEREPHSGKKPNTAMAEAPKQFLWANPQRPFMQDAPSWQHKPICTLDSLERKSLCVASTEWPGQHEQGRGVRENAATAQACIVFTSLFETPAINTLQFIFTLI